MFLCLGSLQNTQGFPRWYWLIVFVRILTRCLCDVPDSQSQRCRRWFAEEMSEIGVRRREAKRSNAGIKIIVRNIKVPHTWSQDCKVQPWTNFRGVQLLPKRCWCHVTKHHASFVRHRLESWSIDKSWTMKIGPNLLVLCPSALVASLDVDVLVQDFTYPKWGTGQPIIIMFWKLLQQTFEREIKMTKWCG